MTPDSHVLLRAFAEELARCGVTEACTSPGSRSTPLVFALVREPGLRARSHLDERSAGFFAVGLAKASGRPVVLACTSGTAAANYAPAVHEAREARVPLLVLTADRPPELRDTGAGQTIDQIKLYGPAAKWFFEVGVDRATPDTVRWMRRLACRAVWTAVDGRPGVVHLNFPFREPLVVDGPLPEDPAPGRPDGAPWVARTGAAGGGTAAGGVVELAGPGVVVAGQGTPDPAGVVRWAEAAGWPILGDPLSGTRTGRAAIAHYEALLRHAPWADAHRPAAVVRAGDLPTSKPLREWLAGLDVPQVAVDPESFWQDPHATVSTVHRGGIDDLRPAPADAGWLDAWRSADATAAGAIRDTIGDDLSEPRVALELGATLTGTLWVASSMPVRDVETFAPVRDPALRTLANRGANGIDGTVSSAFGAAADGGAVTLLIGDVALLHDLGGLLAHRRLGLEIRIVLLNNDGGGIFEFLPVAGQTDVFEEHVATPHGIDFAAVAALFGLGYAKAETLDDLRRPGLIEVRTDRKANVALHRRVWSAVAAALDA
jgi:2-succinyl-5-enolpyruvyl-6-hydroxy-3-cyclohexene-1-carboxylate synthase